MKRTAVFVLGMAFAFSLLTQLCFAAEKLAYVDLSRLFGEYSKTKEYDKVLTDKETSYTSERDKKVNEIKALEDKMKLLSDKEKETKAAELKTKYEAFDQFNRQKQMDLRKEQDEKMKEILKDIEEAVKQYAEKDGISMVFNDRVLVYQNKAMDITDKVIDILGKGTGAVKK